MKLYPRGNAVLGFTGARLIVITLLLQATITYSQEPHSRLVVIDHFPTPRQQADDSTLVYGSFSVIRESGGIANREPIPEAASIISDPYRLTLGGVDFTPGQERPNLPSGWDWVEGEGADLHLIQLIGPTRSCWLKTIEAQGLKVIQYLYPFTYVVWGTPSELRIAEQRDFIRWTGAFLPGFRVLPRVRALTGDQEAIVLWYRGADDKTFTAGVAACGGLITHRGFINAHFEVISIRLSGEAIQRVACIPGVYSIQVRPGDGGLRGEVAAQVNAGNVDLTNLAYPGYLTWLAELGLSGAGVIIANVDSGIDDAQPDLSERITTCFGQTCGGSASSGHGTHTAGIMAADGASGILDANGFLRGLGSAPGALLVEQLDYPWYTLPNGMLLLMKESYQNGASLSGNSWGPSSSPQGYDNDTMQADIGVRDTDPETPGNQSLSYVLSVMNGGGWVSTQGTPDEAKNIFTIGATMLQEAEGTQMLNLNDLSPTTAHGPALDGRIIPHLTAPGCHVDSTVTGGYTLMCGTSMASPNVSGAGALFIEYYRNLLGSDPSPAMIKAAFLPVAHDCAGSLDANGNVMGHPFEPRQGWGRLNLNAVINPQDAVQYYENPVIFDETGELWEQLLIVENPANPVRIMLVWTDAAGHGLGGSTPAWNNDLDLSVETAADVYRGNNFGPEGWSEAGGESDLQNNTEGIFLEPTAPSAFYLKVIARNISSDGIPNFGDSTDQDFAVVVYNAVEESRDGVIMLDRDVYTADVAMLITVADLDLRGTGTVPVTVASTAEPQGESVMLVEVAEYPGRFQGSLATTSDPDVPGSLTLSHDALITATYHDADTGSGAAEDKVATARADLEPTNLFNVAVVERTATSAVITWESDEASTSYVLYGTQIPPSFPAGNPTLTFSHRVEIHDLNQCSWLWFLVQSTDEAGNMAEDDNGGSYYRFPTKERIPLLQEDFTANPGWQITGGEWAFGQPTGGGGSTGNPDPTSGYTDFNVYGYNLNGDYSNNMPEYHVTTPLIDCSGGVNTILTFYRWLGVESGELDYDHASVRISTDSGVSWNTVWCNEASLSDPSWTQVTYKLASWADGVSDIRLRWTMGPTDEEVVYCGWNLDDVVVTTDLECDPPTPSPVPTPPSPTPTLTFTPKPTRTPTPAASATPIQYPLGVRILLPTTTVHPGEQFWVVGMLDNPGEVLLATPTFFVLDVYAHYWFWPSWTNYNPPVNPDLDYDLVNLAPGTTVIEVIAPFTWPATGDEELFGLYFYGALLTQDLSQVLGEMAIVSWGYGPAW